MLSFRLKWLKLLGPDAVRTEFDGPTTAHQVIDPCGRAEQHQDGPLTEFLQSVGSNMSIEQARERAVANMLNALNAEED